MGQISIGLISSTSFNKLNSYQSQGMPVCSSQKAAVLKSGFFLLFKPCKNCRAPSRCPFYSSQTGRKSSIMSWLPLFAREVSTPKQLKNFTPSLKDSRLLAAVSSSKMESLCHCSKSFLSILNATHSGGVVFNLDTAHGSLQGFAEAPGTTSSYLLALAFIGPQVIQEKNPASSKRHLIAASGDLQSISAPMHLPQGFLPLLVPQPRTRQPGRDAKGTAQPHHPRNPNSHPPPWFFTL